MIVINVYITINNPEKADRHDDPEPVAAKEVNVNVDSPLQPVCHKCGWTKLYSNLASARKALNAHGQHCRGKEMHRSPFARPFVAAK